MPSNNIKTPLVLWFPRNRLKELTISFCKGIISHRMDVSWKVGNNKDPLWRPLIDARWAHSQLIISAGGFRAWAARVGWNKTTIVSPIDVWTQMSSFKHQHHLQANSTLLNASAKFHTRNLEQPYPKVKHIKLKVGVRIETGDHSSRYYDMHWFTNIPSSSSQKLVTFLGMQGNAMWTKN